MVLAKRQCATCGKDISDKRPNTITCSAVCRQKKYRILGTSPAKIAKQMTGKRKLAALTRRKRIISG